MAPTYTNARDGIAGDRQAACFLMGNDIVDNTQAASTTQIDPRLAFLLRAAARYELVDAGYMSLGQAINGLLPSIRQMARRN